MFSHVADRNSNWVSTINQEIVSIIFLILELKLYDMCVKLKYAHKWEAARWKRPIFVTILYSLKDCVSHWIKKPFNKCSNNNYYHKNILDSFIAVKSNFWIIFIYNLDILENFRSEPESASTKMKTVYDSCVNYGKYDWRIHD